MNIYMYVFVCVCACVCVCVSVQVAYHISFVLGSEEASVDDCGC